MQVSKILSVALRSKKLTAALWIVLLLTAAGYALDVSVDKGFHEQLLQLAVAILADPTVK